MAAIFNNIETITHLKVKGMKALGYIGAFLGGAVAGAALGLLVAPEKEKTSVLKYRMPLTTSARNTILS